MDQNSDPLPNVAVYYQGIDAGEDLSKLGDVDYVVTVRQADEAAAVDAIHTTGAKAFRYVQSYWFPSNREYDGFDIGANLDQAFCETGNKPRIGREPNGVPWYFIDANERVVREMFAQLLDELAGYGYDGIMFDRGLAALTGADAERAGIWHKSSTCTDDPVEPGATLADAYVGLMSEVDGAGLELFQNYGFSPFHPLLPFRPDPADPACHDDPYAAECSHIDDGMEHVDLWLNEAVALPKDELFEQSYETNLAGETHPEFGGKVVGLITEGTLKGDVSRRAVYYQYARSRLFAIPVAVFTGDDECGGNDGLCNRHGIYRELNDLDLGEPLSDEPTARACTGDSDTNCVWSRRYDGGVVVANVSEESRTAEIDLATEDCTVVTELFAGTLVADGNCVDTIDLELPPWSGRILRFGNA
ncbi:MAG: hypothetical protein U5K30_12680 [Acidimicrobiales bacterium]|nr:hypothetical protein [Acidimicrobiales bacterium]